MTASARLAVDACVVGGGPAGTTAAIALASGGVRTALVAAPDAGDDNRVSALMSGSVTALQTLGVLGEAPGNGAPLRALRIVDATQRLLRATEVTFHASEIGLDAFGISFENRHLNAALRRRAAEWPLLNVIESIAGAVRLSGEAAEIDTADCTIVADVVVGADGRHSPVRAAAGIETEGFRYPQTALAFTAEHTRSHDNISTEFHMEVGPLTFAPLPEQRAGVVWVTGPAEAARLADLPIEDLALHLEERCGSFLGKFRIEGGVSAFPLAVQTARSLVGQRCALVGEAGHVIPPIGAQGLNLGLRDAAALAEVLTAAKRRGAALGSAEVLARYAAARRADINQRVIAVDFLNRSLLSDFLPILGARRLGLSLLDKFGPLRRAVMREGIAPVRALPKLMRGEPLSAA